MFYGLMRKMYVLSLLNQRLCLHQFHIFYNMVHLCCIFLKFCLVGIFITFLVLRSYGSPAGTVPLSYIPCWLVYFWKWGDKIPHYDFIGVHFLCHFCFRELGVPTFTEYTLTIFFISSWIFSFAICIGLPCLSQWILIRNLLVWV